MPFAAFHRLHIGNFSQNLPQTDLLHPSAVTPDKTSANPEIERYWILDMFLLKNTHINPVGP